MWKNIVETNIMIGTHADSLVAEAVLKGFSEFDLDLAYEAVYQDATVPPFDIRYYDREEVRYWSLRSKQYSNYIGRVWVTKSEQGYRPSMRQEAGLRTMSTPSPRLELWTMLVSPLFNNR